MDGTRIVCAANQRRPLIVWLAVLLLWVAVCPVHAQVPPPPPAGSTPVAPPPPAEALPPPPSQHVVPLWTPPATGTIDIQPNREGRVSLVAKNAPLNQVLALMAQAQGVNLVCAQDITATVSVTMHDVPWQDALNAVLSTAGYTAVQNNNIVRVTSIAAGKGLAPDVQGRCLQVFALDYASGTDVEKAVKPLLSPVGNVILGLSSSTEIRRPKDTLVVEDLPAYAERIAQYIYQVDQPPRQVLIEAHVLEVNLEDELKHGVNFDHLFSVFGQDVSLSMQSMGVMFPQTFTATVNSANLHSILEWLRTTTDSKTLASPRVLVTDGQQARIQVGEKLGYKVTTTTETSTMQNVNFLEVGVVLVVTPCISRDGRVLLKVKPKVSSGAIDPDTELPNEKTSEVESNVLLTDGQGVIIGGLIQERDSNRQSKIPFFGDLWLIGSLFQKRLVERKRTETIVALIPHVHPYSPCPAARDALDTLRASSPILENGLHPAPRPWEPRLPDAIRCLDRGIGKLPPQGEPACAATVEEAPLPADGAPPMADPLPSRSVPPGAPPETPSTPVFPPLSSLRADSPEANSPNSQMTRLPPTVFSR